MGLHRKLLKQRRERRSGNPRSKEDLADYYSRPELSTWFSGSFAEPRGGSASGPTEEAAWGAVSRFERRLGQMVHSPIPALVVVETEEQEQRTNAHLLLGGVSHLAPDVISAAWRLGNTTVGPARRHHALYLANKVLAGTPLQEHPSNFKKALRRVRLLEQRRRTTGSVVYDTGGRVVKKKRPKRAGSLTPT